MTQTTDEKILDNGDSSMTVYFDLPISKALTTKIIQLCAAIKNTFDKEILEVIPAYQSLTIIYESLIISRKDIRYKLINIVNSPLPKITTQSKLINIPVCYDGEYGPDLKYLANYNKLSKQQVIQRHTEPTYLVHMLGFLPGFLYLGGLDKSLFCPRKSTPAIKIPKGSVGIGGEQTGIYPCSSPGGWQLIGRTPLSIFAPNAKNPFIASPLDEIKFYSIKQSEFQELEKANAD